MIRHMPEKIAFCEEGLSANSYKNLRPVRLFSTILLY